MIEWEPRARWWRHPKAWWRARRCDRWLQTWSGVRRADEGFVGYFLLGVAIAFLVCLPLFIVTVLR